MMQWMNLPAWKVGDRGFKIRPGIQVPKKKCSNLSPPHSKRFNIIIVGSLCEREVACSKPVSQEGSVISFISPSPGGSEVLAQFSMRWPKTSFISFFKLE